MNNEQYLEQSARTVSDIDLNFTTFPTAQSVLHQMVEGVQAGMTADCVKRSLFYRDAKIAERVATNTTVLKSMYEAIIANPNVQIPKEKIDLLHAALGMLSEAGEVLEEVVMSIVQEREVDIDNMREEFGDNQWYVALGVRAIQSTLGVVQQENIDKLAKRYPDKFTPEAAQERADKL